MDETNYNEWLSKEYSGWISNLGHVNVTDWKVENEDNSIEIAVQLAVEIYMPKLYNYIKPTVYIRG